MQQTSGTPWQEPRTFCERTFREDGLAKFNADPSGDRQHYLTLIGWYLDAYHPKNFKSVGELRKLIKEDGRVFPTNAGSFLKLAPIVRGVIEKGIEFFPKKSESPAEEFSSQN